MRVTSRIGVRKPVPLAAAGTTTRCNRPARAGKPPAPRNPYVGESAASRWSSRRAPQAGGRTGFAGNGNSNRWRQWRKNLRFSGVQQRAILQGAPAKLESGDNLVAAEKAAQRHGCALIKKNLHGRRPQVSTRLRWACSRTASTCSRATPGNHSRKFSAVAPLSRFSNSACTGTRVPLKSQTPLTFPGIRSTAEHYDPLSMIGEGRRAWPNASRASMRALPSFGWPHLSAMTCLRPGDCAVWQESIRDPIGSALHQGILLRNFESDGNPSAEPSALGRIAKAPSPGNTSWKPR